MTDMERLALKRLRPAALLQYERQLEKRPQREIYRKYFLENFGSEVLKGFGDQQLLELIPINLGRQGMDYTLEFKNDEEFHHRAFGSISGGAASKYGVFRRQAANTGTWWTKDADPATEEQAVTVVRERVAEILTACAYLDGMAQKPVAEIEADRFQSEVAEAAPYWHGSAWLHCYLHIYCPRLVTWSHAQGRLEAELYRLGRPARYNNQRYANDILALQFWAELLGEPLLDVTPHWAQGPRDYWSFSMENSEQALDFLRSGWLAVGPSDIGDLGEAYTFKTMSEIGTALAAEFQEIGRDADLSYLKWLGVMKPGELVVVVRDGQEVLGVGELEESGYEYASGETKPHRRRVRWLHNHPFQLQTPVKEGLNSISLKLQGLNVPLIEQSLLAYGSGEWPDIQPNLEISDTHSIPLPKVNLEPLSRPNDPIVREILNILKKKGQVILYGPPGTGKTYFAERAVLELVASRNFGVSRVELTTSQRKRAFENQDAHQVPYISTCTFHLSYAYEDFIEGYRPTSSGGFELRDGIFKRTARAALADPENSYVLIVDEVNRGNIPKIMGELITLLEFNKRGRLSVLLPVSAEAFTVPKNLFVIATMNTADRSILLLDTALRRRFGFLELMPDPKMLESSPIEQPNLALWLAALNRRVVQALGRDGRNLQVGHAYLMEDDKPFDSLERFLTALQQELWPLLQEYCYEDSQALTAILGKAPNGLYDVEQDTLAWRMFEPKNRGQLLAALESFIEPEDTERMEPSVAQDDYDGDTDETAEG